MRGSGRYGRFSIEDVYHDPAIREKCFQAMTHAWQQWARQEGKDVETRVARSLKETWAGGYTVFCVDNPDTDGYPATKYPQGDPAGLGVTIDGSLSRLTNRNVYWLARGPIVHRDWWAHPRLKELEIGGTA